MRKKSVYQFVFLLWRQEESIYGLKEMLSEVYYLISAKIIIIWKWICFVPRAKDDCLRRETGYIDIFCKKCFCLIEQFHAYLISCGTFMNSSQKPTITIPEIYV